MTHCVNASVKTAASVRSVPLHDNLLLLGLRQFVERRAKRYPKQRVFREFRLGTKGRKSEGATRFWGDLLKRHGLWKPGRSTYDWRQPVAAFVRGAGGGGWKTGGGGGGAGVYAGEEQVGAGEGEGEADGEADQEDDEGVAADGGEGRGEHADTDEA